MTQYPAIERVQFISICHLAEAQIHFRCSIKCIYAEIGTNFSFIIRQWDKHFVPFYQHGSKKNEQKIFLKKMKKKTTQKLTC